MALVGYSDSEDSDTEVGPVAPPPTTQKPTLPKKVDRTESRKIKVDLPTIKPELGGDGAQERAPKRAKTGGAFSGFNSFLPAPNRTAAQSAPKAGIGLRTSSEAAFSRAPAPRVEESEDVDFGASGAGGASDTMNQHTTSAPKPEEPKIVGKPTRFLPLSVANAKKKKPKPKADVANIVTETRPNEAHAAPSTAKPVETDLQPAPKPKRSLFSISTEEEVPKQPSSTQYEPEFVHATSTTTEDTTAPSGQVQPIIAGSIDPNSLEGVAADLNLTPAQRRQLFGRRGKDLINVSHFNMDAEYQNNQDLAAKGEVLEHRAVKTVAPGKHSLQQLVNNVRGQTDALEDKWAAGRKARGEGGSKYGW